MRSSLRLAAVAAFAAAALLAVPQLASAHAKRVFAEDDCEPVSFNNAIGPGTCVGHGATTFGEFISQLVHKKTVPTWRFSPSSIQIHAGTSLLVTNRGGETHTFTEVTQFGGGGIVPELNLIMFGTETPPVFFVGPFNFFPARGTFTASPSTLTRGTHLFICAIHPWMEMTAVVGPPA